MESKVCRKCFLDEDHGNRTLFKCAKCSKYKTPDPAFYCSRECQKDDWENGHKDRCKKVPPEVVAARARSPDGHDWCQDWRKCVDTSLHFGDLELITWDGLDEDGETERGWGGCYMHQADTLKRKFEVEMGGDKLKLLFDRGAGNAFRWTCCGMSAWGGKCGCDHHGHPDARKPCGCDFCKMGKPLTASLMQKYRRSQRTQGLELRTGPDPRSLNPMAGGIAETMRGIYGMDK